ncbi:MAG: hypothetical protein K8T91_04710 [Planctomycetes bacterium]|nr:hypothetical protein [Planctomycetota bacterium]
MIQKHIKDELLEQFDKLTPELQRRVVKFAQETALESPRGARGADLVRFVGTISADESRQLREAIDEACEQVDPHAW